MPAKTPSADPKKPMSAWGIANEFFDHSVRAEEIVWLGAQCDSWPNVLNEMCEDLQDLKYGELDKVFSEGSGREIKLSPTRLPKHKNGEYDDITADALMEVTIDNRLMGFMVKFATPIPTNFHAGGGYTAGFGYYRTRWFYTEAFDEALLNRALKWQKSVEADAKKDWKKEQKKLKS